MGNTTQIHRPQEPPPILEGVIFKREAVRAMTAVRQRYSGDVGRTIRFHRGVLERNHFDHSSGLPFLREGMADEAFWPHYWTRSTGRIEIDPFLVDGLDLFALVTSFDDDHASKVNHVGWSKDTSPEAHAIFAWLRSGRRIDMETLGTLQRIVSKHMTQAATHLADHLSLEPAVVESILRERRDLWASARVKDCVGPDPVRIEDFTYLFISNYTIQIHFGRKAPRIAHIFQHYRDELMLDGGRLGKIAADFYATHGHEGSGYKTFNGRKIPYKALLFPRDPVIAQGLLEELEAYDMTALVDHSVRVLVDSIEDSRPSPPVPSQPRPGR